MQRFSGKEPEHSIPDDDFGEYADAVEQDVALDEDITVVIEHARQAQQAHEQKHDVQLEMK